MNLEIVSIASVAEVNLIYGPFFIYNIIKTCKKVFASNVSSLKPRTDAAKTHKS